MKNLLKGIYRAIYGYIDDAQIRRDYLAGLIIAARSGEYEEDALKAWENEYDRLSEEIQKLSEISEEVKGFISE